MNMDSYAHIEHSLFQLIKVKEPKDFKISYTYIEDIGQFGFIEIDYRKKRITVSEGITDILNIKKSKKNYSIGQLFENVEKDDREKLFSAFYNKLIKNKKEIQLDIKLIQEIERSKDISYLNFKAKPVTDKKGEIHKIYAIVCDITQRIRFINELKKTLTKLEESDKLKSSFLANISHELRTPMNAILGFTELINIGSLNNEKRQEYTNIIKRKGKYLLVLLDDIVEISKYETGTLVINKSECNVIGILEELFIYYDKKRIQTGKSHIELKLIKPKEKVNRVFTDSGRLHQVLSNLLSNAFQFTVKGYIEFGLKVIQEKSLQFYVKDTGLGLTKEDQKYIFHRFKNIEETTRGAGESGLKLTISKDIIELLGGKIWVDSEPNEGSAFYFTIPYTLTKAELDKETTKETGKVKTYNWKDKVILVVEDEEDNYTFIEAILHDTQAQIIHANNGKQAEELCKSINKIDLVLMDIKMPQKSGYESAKEIKKIRPDLPIIAQTAFSMKEIKKKCLDAGCIDYIAKPFDVDVFINMINKYIV